MDLEAIRNYCLKKKFTEESMPFGDSTLVFKVCGKIFMLMGFDRHPLQFNVKCDPDKAEELRAEFPSVIPAFHMNKKHWNTIIMDGHISAKQAREWIDDSFALVVQSLPLRDRKNSVKYNNGFVRFLLSQHPERDSGWICHFSMSHGYV